MVKSKPFDAGSMLSPVIEGIKENIIGGVNRIIKEKIKNLEKLIFEMALGFMFFAAGVLFLLIALIFFFKEILHLSYFYGFLCAGIAGIIISFIFYLIVKKN